MKLLIADDDRPTRIKLVRTIEKWGYDIVEADDGKTALDILQSPDPPRIALLDWMMPGIDGVEICKTLADDPTKPLIYRILITMKQEKEDLVTALDSGAHDFLSKPVDKNELRSRIAVGKKLIQAEDDLKESQRRLSTLLSNMLGMAYRCRYEERRPMEFVSNACFFLTGIPADRWNDTISYSDLIHPDDRDSVWNDIQTAVREYRPFQSTYRIHTPNTPIKWVWEQGQGIYRDDRYPIALEGYITDISERKRLEETVLETQKMKAITRLAEGIAHDFNNFFMIIRFYTDAILKALPVDSAIRDDAITIQEVGQRASSLSKNLLAFSQNQTVDPTRFDIHSFVLKFEKILASLLGESIRLEIVVSEESGLIQANPGQIEQIMMNLVLNAREAIRDRGIIQIQTRNIDNLYQTEQSNRLPARGVEITVKDSGCGIDEESKQLIFEPFYTTKDAGNESGLGLSIVYGIVQQLGGTIDVQSEVGKGSEFIIRLPQIAPDS